jgi:hypothetical protein
MNVMWSPASLRKLTSKQVHLPPMPLYNRVASLMQRQQCFCHLDVMADEVTFYVLQGAIMAVGASRPVVVATADGMFGVKKQMQVS